jgi:hypothetical protein
MPRPEKQVYPIRSRHASAVAEAGRQYALYVFRGKDDGKWGAHFLATPGAYEDTITLKNVPAGEYALEWIDPSPGGLQALADQDSRRRQRRG